MRRILILIFSFLLLTSCLGRDAKKEETKLPPLSNEVAIRVYKEGLENLKAGNYFYASKNFSEAETLLPQTEWAEKSALMASYCLYAINFYEEALLNLEYLNFLLPKYYSHPLSQQH